MFHHFSRRSRFTITALALLAAASAFAMACADDDDGGGDGTPAATSAAGSPASGAPTVVRTPAANPTAAPAIALQVAQTATLGPVLADAAGMTLYVFANDTAGSGKSACVGGCATAWPPLITGAAPAKSADVTGDVATIARGDGGTQVTYKGLPLYYFANDEAPGDTNGEGLGGVWTVAKP